MQDKWYKRWKEEHRISEEIRRLNDKLLREMDVYVQNQAYLWRVWRDKAPEGSMVRSCMEVNATDATRIWKDVKYRVLGGV